MSSKNGICKTFKQCHSSSSTIPHHPVRPPSIQCNDVMTQKTCQMAANEIITKQTQPNSHLISGDHDITALYLPEIIGQLSIYGGSKKITELSNEVCVICVFSILYLVNMIKIHFIYNKNHLRFCDLLKNMFA